MAAAYFEQTNERTLSPDYAGPVLVWDIDKTYLDTRFSSWRGLMAIPFEFAIDKRTIPGSVPVLRALRHGPDEESAITPLYFVSGSPPQLRRIIEKRMTLDGVEYDGITFKDQLGLALARRFADVRGQMGYKLQALLGYRTALPDGARWWCFGDDVESDAEVFVLFGRICAGLRGGALEATLSDHHVHPDDVRAILELAEALPTGTDPVQRVFIHLDRRTPPERFTEPRVVPTQSYLQTALVLLQLGRVRPRAVSAVAKELRRRGVPEADIVAHLEDAAFRLGVPMELTVLAGSRER